MARSLISESGTLTAARLISMSPRCCRWRCLATSASRRVRSSGVDRLLTEKNLGDRSVLVARPGVEGGDESRLVNHAVLQGDQTEEEVAFGGDRHAKLPGLYVRRRQVQRQPSNKGALCRAAAIIALP